MSRLIVPLTLIIAAIGLFAVYTNPLYQNVKDLETQNSLYDDALNKSQELHATRDQLLNKRNTFADVDVQKLERVLPDNVDNIRLIIDINNIAGRHGLTLSNVSLGDVGGSVAGKPTVGGAASAQVGTVSVGFAVATNYDTFLAFLQDLEHSLRLVDVTKITYTPGQAGADNYAIDIKTYWLH